MADRYLTNPAQVSVSPQASTAERVAQFVSFVQQSEKQALLTIMLRAGFSERGNMDRVLIFTRTKHGADRVVRLLGQNGIAANAIHGNKSQPQRERALADFKAGKVKILIATDIAARGIDVSGVSHVINFELPNVPEQYVHRIGRTARAGAEGIAIAYCADDERPYLKDIEKLTRQRIEQAPLPQGFTAEAARIRSTRVETPASREARSDWSPSQQPRRDERPRSYGPSGQRGRFANRVKPMGGGRRSAARG